MPPGITEIIRFRLVPVVGHFDRRALILTLVTDKGIRKASVWILVLTQYLHAQDAGVKIQGLFLVEYANHRMVESEIGFLIAHGLPLLF